MKKYNLTQNCIIESEVSDENINAVINKGEDSLDRMTLALREHYDCDVEILSIEEKCELPFFAEMKVLLSNETEVLLHLEQVWTY